MAEQSFKYQPEIFNQGSYETAKKIVLTDEPGANHEQRWEQETAWLAALLNQALPKNDFLALDFGCGVGRTSKILIEAGYTVLGVDISAEMRVHSAMQLSLKFSSVSPEVFDKLIDGGARFDLATSIWVLQHCPNLELEVMRIFNALKPGGVLFVADMSHRAIPTDQGWVHDGKEVFPELIKCFELIQKIPYSYEGAAESLRQNAWLAFFRKPMV